MQWKSFFEKEIRIRLTEEGDGFVATITGRARRPKSFVHRFVRFVIDETVRRSDKQGAPVPRNLAIE